MYSERRGNGLKSPHGRQNFPDKNPGQNPRTKSPQTKTNPCKNICVYACVHIVLYCIVSMHLYSASCSAHQSEALPVRETQREESSLERTKRGTWLTS